MADSYGRKKEMNFIAFKLILLQISKETVCPCFISVELNLSLRRNDGFELSTHIFYGCFLPHQTFCIDQNICMQVSSFIHGCVSIQEAFLLEKVHLWRHYSRQL